MKRHLFAIFFIAIIIIAFFGRLFFPEPKLFYTPDYARSDIWNQNYPFKDFLSRSLKKGELPFWSKDIGTGFPLFDELQIGALYLPNVILFFLFDTWFAWNLSYILVFFLTFLGSYLFFQRIGISRKSSFFSAFCFSFGGHYIGQITHTDFIQSASLFPWIFLTGSRLLEKVSKKNVLLFGFVLSQQIFAGGVQWVLISIIGLSVFCVAQYARRDKDELVKKSFAFLVAIILGLALSAPQLLPSIEYKDNSIRRFSLPKEYIFQYPYGFKHLVTFVLPNYFGTPKDGSFPIPFRDGLGIYWENSAYVGLLTIAFFLIWIFKKKKNPWEKSFALLGIFSLLLVFGDKSPLSFVFSFPVFSQFRVPSRFLILTTFSITGLAGAGLDMILDYVRVRKKIKQYSVAFYIIVMLASIADLFLFGYSYHPLVSADKALKPPEILDNLPSGERMYTSTSQKKSWNEVFFDRGWSDISDYLYFKNGLDADLNLLFDRPSIGAYSGLPTLRQFLFEKFIANMLNPSAVRYLISTESLEGVDGISLDSTVEPSKSDLPRYYIYKNEESLDRIRLVTNYTVARTASEIPKIIAQDDFSFNDNVVLESDPKLKFESLSIAEVGVLQDGDQRLLIKTNTDKRAILVIADSYYSQWRALINNEEIEIIPANINQRALIIPPGENIIELKYYPSLFYRGVVVGVLTFVLIVIFLIAKPEDTVLRMLRRPLKGLRKILR